MSNAYGYVLMPSAVKDLEGIMDYISYSLHAPDSAINLLNEIESAIESACDFPMALPPVNDELLRAKGYRKIVVRNYIVFVLPDGSQRTLNIMRVLYHGQDYLKAL